MLVARLTLYHEDYRDLLYSSLDRHRRRATAPDAAAAAGAAGAAAGAASGGGAGGAARALAQFLSAIRALCPAAPRLELEAYSRVLSRVAQEWGAAADAARQQRAEVADILKTCIKDQEAAKQDEGARCVRRPLRRPAGNRAIITPVVQQNAITSGSGSEV